MSINSVSPGDTITAAHINSFKEHLEGDSSSTLEWFFRVASGADCIIRLSDAAGAQKLSVTDSAGVEVASIDSDGNLTISGSYSPSALVIPNSAAPTPTTEGSVAWDSDDHRLLVGNGTDATEVGPTRHLVTADQTINSTTTATNITGMGFKVAANHAYKVEGVIRNVSPAAADIDWGVTIPSGAEVSFQLSTWQTAGSSGSLNWGGFDDGTDLDVFSSTGSDTVYRLQGYIHNGATAGTVQLTYAQRVSDAGNTTIQEGTGALLWDLGAWD